MDTGTVRQTPTSSSACSRRSTLASPPRRTSCRRSSSTSSRHPFGIDLRPDAPPARYVETEDAAMDWDYVLWRGASFLELLVYLETEN
jgi:hypothetical protein